MNARAALKTVLALPEEDRRWVVEEAAATLTVPAESFKLTPEQKAELDRRVADLHAHPERGIPWAEVKRQVRQKLRHARRHLGPARAV